MHALASLPARSRAQLVVADVSLTHDRQLLRDTAEWPRLELGVTTGIETGNDATARTVDAPAGSEATA